MGKRIIQQARGKGSMTYRVRRKAFSKKISYPRKTGEAEIINLVHSAGHSAPLIKLKLGDEVFFLPAFNGAYIEQKVTVGGKEVQPGNILELKDIPPGIQIYNVERNPGDGGKMMRAAGTSIVIGKKQKDKITLLMSNKKQVVLNSACRATIGKVAGDGMALKPFVTAGKKYYKMKAKSKLWPRVSAVAVNAVDHPFGSGRGKRIKPKIVQRNASPGQKVGHLRPRRTGYRG